MDPISLNLRVGRLPAASEPTGGALSAAEVDANFIALKTAAEQIDAEVVDARGDRTTLGKRISNIGNFASPNAGGTIVGNFYDNAFHATAAGTATWATGRLDMAPFFTSQRLRIDQIGVGVSTAAAGAARCVIYESTDAGWPDARVLTADILDTGTVGYRFATVDFTFDSGRQYWLGLHTAAGPGIRVVPIGSAVNLGINGSNGTAYYTAIRRTITYASGAPALWGFLATDLVSGVPTPSIRMRAAALP